MVTTFTTPIKTTQNDLDLVGGKGRSLARMSCADFDVPGGFLVTTDAYKKFIEDSDLKSKIIEFAKPELRDGYPNFETCSKKINEIITNADIDTNITDQIRAAYSELDQDNLSVAVRSSANAEDLPDFSFAGQQETFLNVNGEDAVVSAVKKCWSSLWTSQAISYRHQNGIDQSSVAMGVVVQIMIPSEVSGILFTANPTNGERSEMIINSSFGLGEAVVGGQVTPDTFIVDRETLSSKETVLGPKEHQIVYDGAQGIKLEKVSKSDQAISSLSDSMLSELCEAALKIEGLYEGTPQDIEWAFCKGKLHLLQSRPITNLPVPPIEVEWIPTPPAKYVARRQIVENMPDPLCPLFEELYLHRGLELVRPDGAGLVGGGPMFVTVNGYGYMRFDLQLIHDMKIDRIKDLSEEEIEAEEFKMMNKFSAEKIAKVATSAISDVKPFREDLNSEDRQAFDDWYNQQNKDKTDASELISTEIGAKLSLMDDTLDMEVVYALSEWTDIPMWSGYGTANGPLSMAVGGTDADVTSFELQLDYDISETLSLIYAGAITDSEVAAIPDPAVVSSFPAAIQVGGELSGYSPTTHSITLDYSDEMDNGWEAYGSVDYAYRDKMNGFSSVVTADAYIEAASDYKLLNLAMGMRKENWDLNLSITNAANFDGQYTPDLFPSSPNDTLIMFPRAIHFQVTYDML